MLIIFATSRLTRLAGREAGCAVAPVEAELAGETRFAATVEVPAGTRYQLLRALRAMALGESMVVERRIPQVAEHIDDENRREAWFRSLRSVSSWQGSSDVTPVYVPGTAYPCVIGRILIRSGWCAPSDQPHWVPNLRFFFLTAGGRESLGKAQAWWAGLSPLERMRLMIVE